MRFTAALLALVMLVAAAALAAAAPHQQHHFETPKGTVVVTVQHGPPQQQQQQQPQEESTAQASSEESSSEASQESSSEESSSEASQESSSEESSAPVTGTPDLSHYTLPPEPAAAKGYRPVSCPGDDPCNEQPQEQPQQETPCTENCEAQQAPANQAAGAVVFSQPLGDATGDNGYAPARGTATGGSVDTSSWQVVPQTGLESNTAMPSNAGPTISRLNTVAPPAASPAAVGAGVAVGEPHPSAPPSCGCDVCPCKYVSPAERRAQRLAQLEAQEKAERDQEKSKMQSVMVAHKNNLEKIEQMSRALRWQYTQLRRQHNLLRAHISANKAAFQELGGDNEYKGTDLDIEATPNTYETLDDIPAGNQIRVHDNAQKRITDGMNARHDAQKSLLAKLHKSTAGTIKAIAGDAGAAKAEDKPAAGEAKATKAKAASSRSAAEAAIAEAEAAKSF